VIEKAMSEVHAKYSNIITMRELQGCSERDLMTIEGISRAAAKSRTFHARRRLKEKILAK
jgi:DNA-directed RNA polymerase specialized sigma24 family protein